MTTADQLINAIATTIAAGRDRGDTGSAILREVESLLAGVEVFLAAATSEHIDGVSTCGVCTRPVEHIAGIKDPYWRHVGVAAPGRPHAARPASDGLPRNEHGGVDLAALNAMPPVVGDVDNVRREVEDGDPQAPKVDHDGYAPTEPARTHDDGWRDEATGLISGGLVPSCSVCGHIREDEPHDCKAGA